MKSFITLFFLLVFVSTAMGQMANRIDKLEVNDLTTKKLDVVSTVSGAKPCPSMTQVQRDAIVSPIEGQCIYNSTAKTLNLYDGAAWVEVAGGGGEGGIAGWEASKFYEVGDVVIYLNDIYKCTVEHTSDVTFNPSNFQILAQDLTNTTGILSLSKGGTNKALTPSSQGVVFSDADSLEILPKGPNRSLLKIGDTGDLTFGDVDFSDIQGQLTDGQIQDPVSLEKGGTNKALTAQDKAIVYSDNDSLELLAPGTEGQVLKMGSLAPEWGNAGVSVSNNYSTATELSKLTVPNEVLTEQATGEYYLEKNNNNILSNPSFEGTFPGLWSINVSSDQFGTGAIDGGFMLRAMPSAQTLEILQDSSLYVDAFADGSVQGMASARIKTSVSGVKLCPRKAAVTQTSLCVTHTGSGKWEHLKVPFILGDTSNGLVILTDSTKTGTIYVDDAFVGAVDLSATQSFDTTCDTIACATEFSAFVSFTGTVLTENLDFLGTCTVASTNQFTCSFNSSVFSVAPACSVQSNGLVGGGRNSTIGTLSSSQIIYSTWSSGTFAAALNAHIICQKQGADYTAALQAQKAFQKTKVSSYSSTNADTDWQSCGHTTADFTGFGSVVNILTECKRQGSDLLIKGRFQAGATPTAVEARLALPVWNGVQLVSANTSFDLAGDVIKNNFGSTYFRSALLIEANSSYFTFGSQSAGNHIYVKQTGTGIAAAGDVFSITARIPIEGWENSNIIIGQFNGLEKCESTLDCTDTFSAKVSSAGVVSGENVDWINGNATVANTSQYTIGFNSSIFSQAPNCYISITDSSENRAGRIYSLLSNQVRVYTTSLSGTAATSAFSITCQKQGADYIGKTAKSVASDQNTRMPGITNSKICSANITFSSGAYTLGKHFGACVGSVNSSNGAITFNSGYWTDTPNCTCTAQGSISSVRNCYIDSAVAYNKNGVRFQTADGATNANNTFYFTCTGY